MFKFPVTSCSATKDGLFAIEPYWCDGWDIHFTQRESFMEKTIGRVREVIPFRRGTKKFCLAHKDDIRDELEKWFIKLRRDQHFAGLTYKPVVYVATDSF